MKFKTHALFFFCLGLGFLMNACKQNPFVKKGSPTAGIPTSVLKDTTTISFSDTLFNFDTIQQGEKASHIFKIKNTGEKDLIIGNAYGSCGCTVPEYPKEPIKPGATGDINVTFNSTNKQGHQLKTVTLQVNTIHHNEIIYMEGFVLTDSTKKDKK